MSMKNSNGLFGNRTHDLPACIEVPEPAALPPASDKIRGVRKNLKTGGAKEQEKLWRVWSLIEVTTADVCESKDMQAAGNGNRKREVTYKRYVL